MELHTEDASGVLDLYRSDTIVVRRVATDNRDQWVITFDNYGIGHGFDRPGFGEDWLKAQGVSAIHVLGKAEDWYQYGDIDAALATVRKAVSGATRVMTYGSSMGGYAAIRFADAVGAHAALSLSPQYTLDPRIAAADRRWSQDSQRIEWIDRINGPLTTNARVVMAYDPWGLDGWHGRRIRGDIDVSPLRLPFTAHPATSFLSEIGLLGDLVLEVLNDRLDPSGFEREARRRRATSGVYLGELAGLQPAHRIRTALALARRAVAASPSNHHARLNLARLLLRNGEEVEAIELFEGLVRDSDRALTYLVDYGQALATVGRPAEARAIADEVMAQAAEVAHLNGWAARMCWLNGDTDAARDLIRHAVRLDPTNPAYLRVAADYHLGRRASGATDSVQPTPWLSLARWIGKHPVVRTATRNWLRRPRRTRPRARARFQAGPRRMMSPTEVIE